jgi:hypothetical protein
VADSGNNRIQKFNGSGTFLTTWGGPGSGNGQFYNPIGVALDASGKVYVTDTGNNRVQKFEYNSSTQSYVMVAQLGGPVAGTGNNELDVPRGVAVDGSGNVYVTDPFYDRIQKFNGATGANIANSPATRNTPSLSAPAPTARSLVQRARPSALAVARGPSKPCRTAVTASSTGPMRRAAW